MKAKSDSSVVKKGYQLFCGKCGMQSGAFRFRGSFPWAEAQCPCGEWTSMFMKIGWNTLWGNLLPKYREGLICLCDYLATHSEYPGTLSDYDGRGCPTHDKRYKPYKNTDHLCSGSSCSICGDSRA
jgi:hypothetical protein